MTRYSRQDVLRILHLQTRQIVSWERAGLITPTEQYSFEELGQLRTLRDLQSSAAKARTRISSTSIRASVEAMQRAVGMRNPLLEASAVRQGSRLAFRHMGALLDPLTQQLAFDFAAPAGARLEIVPACDEKHAAQQRTAELQEMFLRAVQMEENPATVAHATELYEVILAVSPAHAPALINLGTIHYNMRQYAEAESLYRRATHADPDYALAFFDLGNVLDEMQQLEEATIAYQKAVALVPQYADAHYNLALAYERQGQRRKALRHWLTYVRLDPVGPWADHARDQARKIMKAEKLSIVSRRGRLVRAG
ncbi:MAG: tetratricopeptide repeat protein [Edaphobacter sp.]|uniref:tetratricopeptide repeat protein n=1 Tax=Edaphobacter sp. TaxID=1934404 RepID=UPI00238BD6D3|nr:tetratricopeptide repeat protein [Edaphobacter sp.]MDE1177096.1 tetratricopeptide repeat protein [Edaphobacter sp.]